MTIRIAAIEVSHWHALYDAAYLRHIVGMPALQLVGVQDPDPAMAAQRAAEVGGPPVFSDYRDMLEKTRPDFVIALGRHSAMAEIAHHLLDEGYPFLIEKPMGVNAAEVRGIADRAAQQRAFVAVPFAQRHQPFFAEAKRMLADGAFGPLSHFYYRGNRPTSARYPAWGAPWMLDPAIAGGGCLRNLGAHGLDVFLALTGEQATVTGAQLGWGAHGKPVEDYASVLLCTPSGILGTVEVGNTVPGQGGDGEWKLSGRDAMLVMRGSAMRVVAASGEKTIDAQLAEPVFAMALRDTIDRWQRGEQPLTGAEDCWRVQCLVDRAYELAGDPYRNARAAAV